MRQEKGLTQVRGAERLGSSQSRVARMEASDQTVSLDTMIRTLFEPGLTPQQAAKAMAG